MQYKSYLTEVGESKVAAAVQSGVKLDIVSVGVGDGGGNTVEPAPVMTELVNEVARLGISKYSVDYDAKTIEVEAIIPPETGGFIIRELGVFDAEGDLIAVSNYPATEKPVVSSGVVTDVAVGMVFVVSAVTAVNIIVGENSTMVGLTHTARVATTENLTLSGLQTVDDILVNVGDRVLVKNQTAGAENGIYIVLESEWTRALDYDSVEDIVSGSLVSVVEGTANGGYLFQLNTPGPITIGSTALNFHAFERKDKLKSAAYKDAGKNLGNVLLQGDKYLRTGNLSLYSPSEIVGYTIENTGVFGIATNSQLPNSYQSYVTITGVFYNGSRYSPFIVSFGVTTTSAGLLIFQNVLKTSADIPFKLYKHNDSNRVSALFDLSSSFGYLKLNISSININSQGLIDTLDWYFSSSNSGYTEITPHETKSLLDSSLVGKEIGQIVSQGTRYLTNSDRMLYTPSEFLHYNDGSLGLWGLVAQNVQNGTQCTTTISGSYYNGTALVPFFVIFVVRFDGEGVFYVDGILKSSKDIPFDLYKHDTVNNVKALFTRSSTFRSLRFNISSIVHNNISPSVRFLEWVPTDNAVNYTKVNSVVNSLMNIGDLGYGKTLPLISTDVLSFSESNQGLFNGAGLPGENIVGMRLVFDKRRVVLALGYSGDLWTNIESGTTDVWRGWRKLKDNTNILDIGTTAASARAALGLGTAATASDATTVAKGIVELATESEAEARTDTVRAVTPASIKDFALKTEVAANVPAATDTVSGKVELATTSEAAAGSDTVRAVTSAGLSAFLTGWLSGIDWTSAKNANGYQKLPSGLILQWGTYTAAGSGSSITFPLSFPTACVAVINSLYSTADQDQSAYSSGHSTAGFTHRYSGSSSSLPFKYIAIGY